MDDVPGSAIDETWNLLRDLLAFLSFYWKTSKNYRISGGARYGFGGSQKVGSYGIFAQDPREAGETIWKFDTENDKLWEFK